MTNSIKAPIGSGLPNKSVGRLSTISMLAISVGLAAAPAHAQDMTTPDMTASPAPVPATSEFFPQRAPVAEPAPALAPTRADDLAAKGGFDAASVAPEALAQIEREQQARKDAAAAAKSAAATRAAPARMISAPATDSTAQAAPPLDVDGSAALAEGTADTGAVIPMIAPVPAFAAAPEAVPADRDPDWSLPAALAAMLGIGSVGAYAATGRRRSKTRQAAALNAAIMPELRRDPVEPETFPLVDAERSAARPEESKVTTKIAFADFVANLPEYEATIGEADRRAKTVQHRVAAAPRPYLAETDLSRPEGYFTANVGSMPTPQNPFLTRHNRLKRARYLDAKLAGRKATTSDSRTRIVGKMKVSRPMELAFA